MNLASLPPEELRHRAWEIAPSERTHWSVFAQLVGGVEDRALYVGFNYASSRAWGEAELGLGTNESRDLYGLWTLMVTSTAAVPSVPFDVWPRIAKGKALEIRRAVRANIPVAELVAAAIEAETEDELREWIARRTGTELPFVTIEIHAPPEIAELFEATLMLALAELDEGARVASPEEARAMVSRREIRFQTLEVVCAAYVTGRRGAEEHP